MTPPETQSDRQPAGRTRLWTLFLPVLAFAVIVAGWSGFWFFAAGKADEAVDRWISREAERGRVYACANRKLGGYPFRLELVCDGLTATFAGGDGQTVANAPRLHAVAQVYDPKRLIGELTGPLTIVGPDGGRAELEFKLAQASAFVDAKQVDRASLVLTEPRLVVDGAQAATAKAAQAHLRRAPGGRDGDYDVAATVTDGTTPALEHIPVGRGPVSFDVRAEAKGVGDLRPRPMSERLRQFAAANGRVHIAHLTASRGDVAVEGRGDVALDREGRLDGAFDVVAQGVEGTVQELVAGGKKNALSHILGVGAAMLGSPAKLGDKPATSYRVTIDKGRLAIGPIRVAKLPSAF